MLKFHKNDPLNRELILKTNKICNPLCWVLIILTEEVNWVNIGKMACSFFTKNEIFLFLLHRGLSVTLSGKALSRKSCEGAQEENLWGNLSQRCELITSSRNQARPNKNVCWKKSKRWEENHNKTIEKLMENWRDAEGVNKLELNV